MGCYCVMWWATKHKAKNCWAWEQNPESGLGWPRELNGDYILSMEDKNMETTGKTDDMV